MDLLLEDPNIPSFPSLDNGTDSSLDSESDEEGAQEVQEGEAAQFPAMPGTHPNPHIARLIDSLQSPYCHSTSEKDTDEMQNLQDYLDGGEYLVLFTKECRYSQCIQSRTTYPNMMRITSSHLPCAQLQG